MEHRFNELAFADYAVLAAFFLVMTLIGFYFMNRMRDMKDYFSGGRNVPWWLSSFSFYMSASSAYSLVAYSAMAYTFGFTAFTAFWTTAVAAFVSARFFAARWRRAVSTSALEFIEVRFGPSLRQSLAWLSIPMIIIDDGMKIFAIGTIVSAGLGVQLTTAIVLSATIMILYTFLGGLWAVLVTDFVQFIILMTAVLVLIPLALIRVGGLNNFLANVPSGFLDPVAPEGNYGWIYIFGMAYVMTVSYCTRWNLVQRYYSVARDSDARKVGYMVMSLNILTPFIIYLPAMLYRVINPGVADANTVYSLMCRELLPVGMLGLLVAAIFAATMSMLAGDFNSMAAVFTNDFYRRHVQRNASQRTLVLVGRAVTLVIGCVALGIALLITRMGQLDLINMGIQLFSIFIPPIGLTMLVGLVSRRVSNAGALAGFLGGITVGTFFFLLAPRLNQFLGSVLPFEVNFRYAPVISGLTTAATLVGIMLGTALAPIESTRRRAIDAFLDGVEGRGAEAQTDQIPRALGFAPALVAGVAISALGLIMFFAVLFTVGFSTGRPSLGVAFILCLIGLTLAKISKGRPSDASAG